MAPTDKAVILARGLGTRMRKADDAAELGNHQAAVADLGVKALIPLDRPFLDYVLTALADAGYRHICLVIGPEHDALRDYYGRQLQTRRLHIDFAIQEEPKGTADAVVAAESFADHQPITVINSDNYYPAEALRGLREANGSAVALFERDSMLAEGNIPEQRLRKFAVAQITPHGQLKRIIEKPDAAALALTPLWVSMNCWRFNPVIFAACRAIEPSPRGEYELTDAVQHAIDTRGERFQAIMVRGPVLDLSSRQDVAPVAAKLAGTEINL